MRISGRQYFKGDGNVAVEVAAIDDHDVTENLYGHMEDLRAILDGVPAQHRAAVKVDLRSWNDEGGFPRACIAISYDRPATSAEIAAERAKKVSEIGAKRNWLRENIERLLVQAKEDGIDPAELGIGIEEKTYVIGR
jgi:hypothetical protein